MKYRYSVVIPFICSSMAAGVSAWAEDAFELPETVITATRVATPEAQVIGDVTKITAADIRKSGAATITDVLSRVGGLQVYQLGSAGASATMYVRGTNTGHTVVLVDGVRVGSLTLGAMALENLPLEQIDHIEVYRASASSLYGSDAIGGVVQVFTKKGSGQLLPTVTIGAGSLGGRLLSVGASGNQSGTSIALQASEKSETGIDARPDGSSFHDPDKDGYRQRAASIRVSRQVTDQHTLGAVLRYSDTKSELDTSQIAHDDYQIQKNQEFQLFADSRWTESWQSQVRWSRSIDDNFYSALDYSNAPYAAQYVSTENRLSVDNSIALPIGKLLLGAEHVSQHIGGTSALSVNRRTQRAVWAGWHGEAGALDWQADARTTRDSQFGHKTTGSLMLGWHLTPEWRVYAGGGSSFKAPTFNDLYYIDPYGSNGNPLLKPESSKNVEAGIRYQSDRRTVSLVVYKNRVKDLIEWRSTDPTDDFAPWSPVNVASATLKGATLHWQDKLGEDINVDANLDWLHAINDETGKQLIRRASHQGNIQISTHYGQWSPFLNLKMVGRREDSNNTRQLGGYALLDMGTDYQLDNDWKLRLSIKNLLGKAYLPAWGFRAPGRTAWLSLTWNPKQ